jgi:hypothetical protein
MLTTEQEAQKHFYHKMLRDMGGEENPHIFHRPPMNRNEILIAQDNAREQAKRTYGPDDTKVYKNITENITISCEICGSTESLTEKRSIYLTLCYNRSKISFYRCPECRGL